MKNISIIGCGWLGEPAALALLEQGYQIFGTTRSSEKQARLQAAGIQASLLDLTNPQTTDSQLWQADIFFINIPPARGDESTLAAYPQRISWLIEQIIKVPREEKAWIIFASSSGVYGDSEEILTENSPRSPKRPSAKAILAAEQALEGYLEQIDLTILRFAGLVGGQRQAGRFLAGKKDLKMGDLPVNLVHRDDCIAILEKLIERNLRHEILNICADEHPIHRLFYPAQAKRLGLEPPTYTDDKIERSRIVSNKKLKELLNYEFIWKDPIKFPLT